MPGRACSRFLVFGWIFITLGSGCERKMRAREREAELARQRPAPVQRAPEPLPEEPPVDLLRVPNSGFPCAVDDIFAARCRRCHTIPTRHGAPFVFLTWEDAQQQRVGQPLTTVIGRAVKSGFMPYRIEANPPVIPLTDAEKQVITDWVDRGAPREVCDPNAKVVNDPAAKRTKSQRLAQPAPSAAPRP
jgi:hypothetical protein